jgi:hypothetical protein
MEEQMSIYCSECKKFVKNDAFDINSYYDQDGHQIYFSQSSVCMHDMERNSEKSVVRRGHYKKLVCYRPNIKNKNLDCPDFVPNFWCSLKLVINEFKVALIKIFSK